MQPISAVFLPEKSDFPQVSFVVPALVNKGLKGGGDQF